tara:strand:- start:104 stop:577 length:474 start_codon:yes stop_codon:yes gene_type:complete
MEAELNGAIIKLEDGEFYYWYVIAFGKEMKNPYWRKLTPQNNNKYLTISINGRYFYYHRLIYFIHNQEWNIWDIGDENKIDHIDRNPNNNNIENLRIASALQNNHNRVDKNYYWDKAKGKYSVQICVNYKKIWGGRFKTEEEAIARSKELKLKYHQF